MKKKSLFSLLFFFVVIIDANAQSHTYKMGCRYFKPAPVTQGKAVTGESVCPVCYKQKEDERQAKLTEDKRRADVAAAEEKARAEKIKADKAAAEVKQNKGFSKNPCQTKNPKISREQIC